MKKNKTNESFNEPPHKFNLFKKLFPLDVSSIEDLQYFNHPGKTPPFETFGEVLDKTDPWYYDLNELGLRGKLYKNKEVDCAFFGCSFTFGQGVKFEKTWPYLVGEKLFPKKWINFGQMGASFRHVSDVFIAASCIYNIKNAVFLLPPFERTKSLTENKDYRYFYSIIPQIDNDDPSYYAAKKFYKNYNELDHFQLFMDNLVKIELNARLKNTKIFWATFDPTSSISLDVLGRRHISWDFPLFSDIARDESHPGPKSHRYFAKQILSYIKENSI